MNDFTNEQMRAAFQKAPEPVRDAITDPATDDLLSDLQSRYHLHIDVMGELNAQTNYFLVGLIDVNEYAERLRTKARIPGDAAGAIVAELNAKIFVPLREKLYGKNKDGLAQSAPEPQLQKTARPPTNLPGAPVERDEAPHFDRLLEDHEEPSIPINRIPPPVAGAAFPTVSKPAPKPAPPQSKASAALVKEYSVDPYREPIDDEK